MADTEQKKETEKVTPKTRSRPIVRLGIFLISHSLFFSVTCCIAGVLALLLLPVLAKNTYISENALMPGSASSMLSNHDISEANRLVKELSSLKEDDLGIESLSILARYMSDMGAEVSYHKFYPQQNQFHPLHFFSSPDSGITRENFNCSPLGVNTVGIIRAPRGDGKEAIVLVTPYSFGKRGSSDTLSLTIAYSVFALLSRVTWLAKDIIWLVADSKHGEYASIAAWLRDYHTPVFTGLASVNTDACLGGGNPHVLEEKYVSQTKIHHSFRRAGTMTAALVVKVTDRNDLWDDTLSIYAEASNGQMPNLDLINIANYLAVHRQGFHVRVQKLWSQINPKWLEILGKAFEYLGKVARNLNPDWKFGIPAADYIEGAVTLASSLYLQALGIPTGSHGAFRDFQVDAITLEISPKVSFNNKARRNEFLLRGGRMIEGVIRSVNNLLEKFHHSSFLYLLTSPGKFVSVGVYMIAFALLVAPLPLVAASLYADANGLDLGLEDGKSSPKVTELNEKTMNRSNEKHISELNKKDTTELKAKDISELNEKGVTELDDEKDIIALNNKDRSEWNEKGISKSNEKDNAQMNVNDITFRPWRWLNAAKEVFVIHMWGALVALLPYFICCMHDLNPTASFTTWALLSALTLLILYLVLVSPFSQAYVSELQKDGWKNLKSVTISTVFIGLLLMSVVNFATAEIGALILVPTCLMAYPLKLDIRTKSLRSLLRLVCNLILGLVVFPPITFFLSRSMFEGVDSIDIGDFWNWVESLWAWSSATYIYVGMVHLPCWVLCIHILLHSC